MARCCAWVRAVPSFERKTIDPVPPASSGISTLSRSSVRWVSVPGMVNVLESLPMKAPAPTPMSSRMTAQMPSTAQRRR